MRLFPSPHHLVQRAALACVVASWAAACGGSGDSSSVGECLSAVNLDCKPQYQPTFDNIFDHRLGVTCGASSTGRSCHAEAGAMAGLVLATKDGAYDALLGKNGGKQRVIPGDPECSLMAQRIESKDPNFMMPPGDRLSDSERCAILQWIANGAER